MARDAPDRMLGRSLRELARDARTPSVELAERIVRSMSARLGLPRPLAGAIAAIVQTHMAPASVECTPSPRAVRRLHARLAGAGTSLSEWAFVVRCDGEARAAAARPDASLPWMTAARTLGLHGSGDL